LGRGVKGLPTASALKVGKGNAGSYPVGPWAKHARLAQERKLAKDLKRGLLKDIVSEGDTDETEDVAAQRRMDVAEQLFQCGAIAGLGEKDEEGLVGRLNLLLVHA
jgi:hypothetical protein